MSVIGEEEGFVMRGENDELYRPVVVVISAAAVVFGPLLLPTVSSLSGTVRTGGRTRELGCWDSESRLAKQQ